MRAGRWLEPISNGGPRWMVVIGLALSSPVTESGLQAHFRFSILILYKSLYLVLSSALILRD